MRLHQLFACVVGLALPLSTLAQTVSDSLSATPVTQDVPTSGTSKRSQYAPGGYGPSALLNSGHFGIKVGPSLTSAPISGISPNIPKQKMDFHLGVMYRYRFTKFVIQPELLYQLKGGTYQQFQIGSTNRITTENNFNYVSLPIMFGYMPTEGLTFQAGPEFSWAIDTPNGPKSNRDLGIALGIHYDFLDMLDKFSLNIRYVYGVTKIPETVNSTLQNRAFQISLVYNFYKK
ncbi:porin family protein [Fibrella sp. ES10-3-2-2]|nr:hypothetical protein A6C57_06220 [Fibrella sp. ES10-3-2-2]